MLAWAVVTRSETRPTNPLLAQSTGTCRSHPPDDGQGDDCKCEGYDQRPNQVAPGQHVNPEPDPRYKSAYRHTPSDDSPVTLSHATHLAIAPQADSQEFTVSEPPQGFLGTLPDAGVRGLALPWHNGAAAWTICGRARLGCGPVNWAPAYPVTRRSSKQFASLLKSGRVREDDGSFQGSQQVRERLPIRGVGNRDDIVRNDAQPVKQELSSRHR